MPSADPDAVVSAGNVRVTVLTPRLLRVEFAGDGVFEDRPPLAVVNRATTIEQLGGRTG